MEVHLISVNIYITKPQYKEHFEPETHSLITICKTDMNDTKLNKWIHMTEIKNEQIKTVREFHLKNDDSCA